MKTLLQTSALAIFAGLLMSLMLPLTVLAQVTLEETLKPEFAPSFTVTGGTPAQGAIVILQIIAGSLIYVAGPLAVLMIAWGGSGYVTSHGDQNQMEGAKKTIVWAIVGLLVIMVSYAIVVNIITIISATGQSTTPPGAPPAPPPPPSK